MIHAASPQLSHSSFAFEIGTYENNTMQLEYADGTVQSCSSFGVMNHVYEQMRSEVPTVSLHEFVGGHNYICYRISLYDRIREVCQRQLECTEASVLSSTNGR